MLTGGDDHVRAEDAVNGGILCKEALRRLQKVRITECVPRQFDDVYLHAVRLHDGAECAVILVCGRVYALIADDVRDAPAARA